jgi:hypothetical protein
MKDKKKSEELGFYKKLELKGKDKIWYKYLPIIFAILALIFAIIDFEVQITTKTGGEKDYKFYCGFTEVFHSDRYTTDSDEVTATASEAFSDGSDNESESDLLSENSSEAENGDSSTSEELSEAVAAANANDGLIGDPNVISIIGTACMILCLALVPKSMLKKREHGDGLGLMFMPLGLMCINNIMCALIYDNDVIIAIIFSVVCFVVSALATFKKTIRYVENSCLFLMIVAVFLFLASFGPYCYNDTLKYAIEDNSLVTWQVKQYYISYLIRDIFTFAAFGIFSSYISNTYKYNEQ